MLPLAHSKRKRLLDLALASVGTLVVLPVLLVLGAAIVLDSGWPPLFAQERVGLAGRPFRMWKLRTMRQNAETARASLLHRNEGPYPVFKVRDDPRVTRVGRLIRRGALDELPQLVNVLRGEMSLVGPRPPLPEEVSRYDAWAWHRLAARPGLTCRWQIARRSDAAISFAQWVEMDLAYLREWRLWTDLRLIAQTLVAVSRFNGE